jgi:galactonate dehydratase
MATIDRVETFLVAPRWLLVRIETSDGVVGWGEATCEGRSETVAAAVTQLAELLVGADPSRIEDHHRTLSNGSFYRGGPILSSAVAGIDQALWDIKGKTLDAPVHELLGGPVRDRVRVYAWVGGDEPHEVRDQIAERVASGLTAVKMNASGRMNPLATSGEIDGVLARVAAAREELGPDREVAVDFHGRVSLPSAVRLAAELVPLRPMFIEEPVVPENSHRIGLVVAATSIPVATGERLYTRQEFVGVLEAGVTIVQPDLSHAGGITEVRKIAALAETYGALLAPHCPLGPIGLAASLQIGFCTASHVIQEQSIGIHYNRGAEVLDYVLDKSPLRFVDGQIERLTGPGLGIEVDEAAVREADARGHTWRTPLWRHPDGALAEW